MDYFEAEIDRSTCYMRRHQDAKVKHFDVSNVIYHKFSHGAVYYTLNGANVNVMLELDLLRVIFMFYVENGILCVLIRIASSKRF